MGLSELDRFELTAEERGLVEQLADQLRSEFDDATGVAYVQRAAELAVGLPARLVGFLESYRREQLSAAVVVAGFDVDDDSLGPTPPHWRERNRNTSREDAYLMLITSRLGDVFCWKSLQDARLLNDVVPVAGDERSQTGHGSTVEFDLHCEDGYNDFRCDFVALMCFRNQERIGTTVALMADIDLGEAEENVLRQERFVLSPDSETVRNATSPGLTGPRPVCLLNGDPDAPYVRIDCREYMNASEGDVEANQAMLALLEEFRRVQQPIHLEPGDVCLIDNFRCVHGRQPFRPKYDGLDRWYRKALVTRDLRKSRILRASSADYVIDMAKYV